MASELTKIGLNIDLKTKKNKKKNPSDLWYMEFLIHLFYSAEFTCNKLIRDYIPHHQNSGGVQVEVDVLGSVSVLFYVCSHRGDITHTHTHTHPKHTHTTKFILAYLQDYEQSI